ncbi:MAG: hypothetical protein Q9173_006954, partial [Seirophora scorigena]
KVAAVVVLHRSSSSSSSPGPGPGNRKTATWSVMDMRRALKDRLANYKIPQELRVLEGGIPKNAMGKVNKKALAKELFGDEA